MCVLEREGQLWANYFRVRPVPVLFDTPLRSDFCPLRIYNGQQFYADTGKRFRDHSNRRRAGAVLLGVTCGWVRYV